MKNKTCFVCKSSNNIKNIKIDESYSDDYPKIPLCKKCQETQKDFVRVGLKFGAVLIDELTKKDNILLMDLNVIADGIKESGIKSISEGWTNIIMDTLEEAYGLETKLRKLLPEIIDE